MNSHIFSFPNSVSKCRALYKRALNKKNILNYESLFHHALDFEASQGDLPSFYGMYTLNHKRHGEADAQLEGEAMQIDSASAANIPGHKDASTLKRSVENEEDEVTSSKGKKMKPNNAASEGFKYHIIEK